MRKVLLHEAEGIAVVKTRNGTAAKQFVAENRKFEISPGTEVRSESKSTLAKHS